MTFFKLFALFYKIHGLCSMHEGKINSCKPNTKNQNKKNKYYII